MKNKHKKKRERRKKRVAHQKHLNKLGLGKSRGVFRARRKLMKKVGKIKKATPSQIPPPVDWSAGPKE